MRTRAKTIARWILQQTPFDAVYVQWRNERLIRTWERAGRPGVPPQYFKYKIIRDYAQRFCSRVLIETGTYLGDMVAANLKTFERIYSIELSDCLYRSAVKRFAQWKHVHLYCGDSALVLDEVLKEIHEPALFWLDGHYSEGFTTRGDKETPIEAEMKAILGHPVKGHVILIDDARCFTGEHDYPTLDALKKWVFDKNPKALFACENDIIRITN